jgi:hypothetical protein
MGYVCFCQQRFPVRGLANRQCIGCVGAEKRFRGVCCSTMLRRRFRRNRPTGRACRFTSRAASPWQTKGRGEADANLECGGLPPPCPCGGLPPPSHAQAAVSAKPPNRAHSAVILRLPKARLRICPSSQQSAKLRVYIRIAIELGSSPKYLCWEFSHRQTCDPCNAAQLGNTGMFGAPLQRIANMEAQRKAGVGFRKASGKLPCRIVMIACP